MAKKKTKKTKKRPGMGPYPKKNVFFPMLNQPYVAPGAINLSPYLPADPYGGGILLGSAPARYDKAVFPGKYNEKGKLIDSKDVGRPEYPNKIGLLYQPWTTQYQQAFVRPNIWNYKPPQLKVGPVQYMYNPYAESPSSLEQESMMMDPMYNPDTFPEYNYGTPEYVYNIPINDGGKAGPYGDFEGDRGYNASLPAYGYDNFSDFFGDIADKISDAISGKDRDSGESNGGGGGGGGGGGAQGAGGPGGPAGGGESNK